MLTRDELSGPENCSHPEIQRRARESVKGRFTQQYVVRESGADVAFVALDVIPTTDYLVLYEIFVAKALRRKGIGSRLLKLIEHIGKERGYRRVTLDPCPLEPGVSQLKLK
jgi:GNAT superfamily N-acetyltransferase